MEKHLWKLCPLISIDPEVVSGEPVFKGTRLPAETITENVDAFMDIEGQPLEEAMASTLECFPHIPGGIDGIRAVLDFRAAHEAILQH